MHALATRPEQSVRQATAAAELTMNALRGCMKLGLCIPSSASEGRCCSGIAFALSSE